ncbi:hypothetical protein RhiirC2_687558, partial [Rhizophagus irregularis]
MWQISSGRQPFENIEHDISLTLAIHGGKREEIINGTPIEYSNMYTKCWRYEPNERPSARKLVTILKSINSTPVDEIHLPENDESIPEIPSLHIHAVHWYQPAAKNGDK